jgi:RNA polymerase sigma factor (sigma-70 family)
MRESHSETRQNRAPDIGCAPAPIDRAAPAAAVEGPKSWSPVRHLSDIDTVWPVLRALQGGTPAEALAAQNAILQRYRPAIYRYLVASLGDPDAADEVCQDFSLRLVRGDFRNADPEKGRFRDLLKTTLYHLIIDYQKKLQRRMSQLPLEGPEPEADAPSTQDADRQFLAAWRAELLNKAWESLAEEEQQTSRPMHTVLYLRANNPKMRSPRMAEELTVRLGKPVTAEWVRTWLHKARERFAELLLLEVAASLREPTPDSVVQELIDLQLFEYCKIAVDRWRNEQAEKG